MTKITLLCIAALGCGALHAQSDGRQGPEPKSPRFLAIETPTSLAEAPQLLAELLPSGHAASFSESATETDALGMTHVTFQQTYRGIPVDGYAYTVHAAAGGNVSSVSGAFAKTGTDVPTTPAIAADAGLRGALQRLNLRQPMWENADAPHDYVEPDGDLVIYHDPATKTSSLAFKYDVYTAEPLYRAWVYVDAQDGRVLFEDLRIHHANEPVQAVSDYNGTVGINADLTNGVYRLRQSVSGGGVETYSLNNGTSYAGASDVTDDGTPFNADGTAVQAHYGAEQTYDYFAVKHNRNSYNGTGGKLLSYVHYSRDYVNAFWDGSRMTYGDGDGRSYGPLTSLDIAGHEMTHGVTEYAAGLIYRNESGALNESFSDIFGEMVEYHATGGNDWQMGTDIGIGGSGAIRSMNNPNAFSDPDTYGGSFYYTGTGDNGGVHINSGVQNKWFYILVVGESGTNDLGSSYAVTGLGRDKAAAIAYRNLDTYLGANSTYADARAGAIQAATDLYGADSPEVIATTDAWYAVGVGSAYSTGGGGGGEPTACVGTDVSFQLVTDNYGSETTWTVKNAAGQTVESGSGYANNTTYNFTWTLADGDYTFQINDSYGDGICCTYGSGSYTLSSDGAAFANGGSFGSSDTKAFCTEGETGPGPDTDAPTVPAGLNATDVTDVTVTLAWSASSDNVGVTGYNVYSGGNLLGEVAGTGATVNGLTAGTAYTFGVSAVDAAGNESAQATTTVTTTGGGSGGGTTTAVLLASYFETGLDGWLDGGSDVYRYSGTRSYEGTRSMRLRDNSGVASSMTTAQGYDLSGAASVDVEFYFYANSMENGEDFWVQYDDGSGFQTVASYARGTNFDNNTFYTATVSISAADVNLSANGRFRFRCDASANGDQVYIDQVTITRQAGSAFVGAPVATTQTCTPLYAATFAELDTADPDGDLVFAASVSPNPARTVVDLRVDQPDLVAAARLYNATGQLVRTLNDEDYNNTLDISAEAAGIYLIVIETTEGETETLRFVKR